MRLHLLARLTLLFAFAVLAGCDNSDSDVPDEHSLLGNYALIRYGGQAIPNGGVTGGELRLQLDQTIPVYHLSWVHNGARIESNGLYTVSAKTVSFFGSSGGRTFDHSGVIEGDRITINVNDGTFTTFTFDRE